METHVAVIIALSFVTYTLSCIMTLLSTTGSVSFWPSAPEIYDKYSLEITPHSWILFIWIFIYIAQLMWMIVDVVARVRYKSEFVPLRISSLYIGVNILNVLVSITFNAEALAASVIMRLLMVMVLTCIMWCFYTGKVLYKSLTLQLLTVCVENAFSLHWSWTLVAFSLNTATVLRHIKNVHDVSSSVFALTIILAVFMIGHITDLLYLRQLTRYTYTPYVVAFILLLAVPQDQSIEALDFIVHFMILIVVSALILKITTTVGGMIIKKLNAMAAKMNT